MTEQHGAEANEGIWNIGVACDIRLGEVLRRNPELIGTRIDINPGAILETLDYFNPDLSGELLFVAAHSETLEQLETSNSSFLAPKEEYVRSYLGGLAFRDDADHKKISIYVNAAGKVIPQQYNATDIVNLSMNKKKEHDNRNGDGIDLDSLYPDTTLVEYDEEPEARLENTDILQVLSVHELRHAVDYAQNIESIETNKLRLKAYGYLALLGVSTGAFTMHELGGKLPDTIAITSGLAVELAAMLFFIKVCIPRIANRTANKILHKMESDAYDTASDALNLPRIIKITT